jgi:hypothetical protein
MAGAGSGPLARESVPRLLQSALHAPENPIQHRHKIIVRPAHRLRNPIEQSRHGLLAMKGNEAHGLVGYISL